jgi:MoaA/NifB/PqqE/SkfB family radical SAM enzyme
VRIVLRLIGANGNEHLAADPVGADNLADGKPNDWRCRAGARYLYICEDGLVHYCSQQRGSPGVPLETYSIDDIRREFATSKSCAPYCTVGCVHRVSTMDFWRKPQRSVSDHPIPQYRG